MKSVLLTGGTGFVGANLVHHLLKAGYELHLLVRDEHQSWRIEALKPAIRLHKHNLQDLASLKAIIASIQPQWIFHLAAYGAYSWQSDKSATVNTNLIGIMNLLDACLETGFESFINFGSSSEYGFKDHPPSEDERVNPNSVYAISKVAATHYCDYIALREKVNIKTLRLYSVFGPYEDPNRLIPKLIVKGLVGRLPQLVNPAIARDFIYVSDVIDAALLLAENPHLAPDSSVLNLGTGLQTSIGDAVNITRTLLKIAEEPQWGSMEARSWDTNSWVANTRQIEQALSWKPQISFADGLQKTINWFKAQPQMLEYYLKHQGD